MAGREHIICVDDEESILSALRQQLGARFGAECDIAVAQSGSDALELIDELQRDGEKVAVVIADQIMPGMKGVELLEEIHRRDPKTTKILLTGQAGLDAVVHAINSAGLNRYISKPWDEPDLRLAVENLLTQYRLHEENQRLVEDLKEKNLELAGLNQSLELRVEERTRALEDAMQRLARMAVTDGLTGLYNHRHFHERLRLEVERCGRTGLPLALCMIDVDHFKHYNDKNGHPAGDEVLRQVARVLAEGRRANDVCARYGGEEFAIVLLDTTREAAAEVADKLRSRIEAQVFAGGEGQPEGRVTISMGVAECPRDATTVERLVQVADFALYAAKSQGRNRVVVCGSPEAVPAVNAIKIGRGL
jgi:diguanylate cyclase (GGDEF)-like protein